MINKNHIKLFPPIILYLFCLYLKRQNNIKSESKFDSFSSLISTEEKIEHYFLFNFNCELAGKITTSCHAGIKNLQRNLRSKSNISEINFPLTYLIMPLK